jgi:hypothetical protein
MSKEQKGVSFPTASDPAKAGQSTNDEGMKATPSDKPVQRPRRDRGNWSNNFKKPVSHPEPKFEGRRVELKGEIYDCTDFRQADGYTKTTKEVAEYIGRVYSGDAWTTIELLTLPVFVYPSDPITGASETDKRKWQKRVESTVVKEDKFEEDLKKVYSLIWGQCTDALRAKLEARGGYDRMRTEYDTIELLKSIKYCVFKSLSQKYGHHA